MPLIGSLTAAEKQLVRDWIDAGALEERPPLPTPTAPAKAASAPAAAGPDTGLWLEVNAEDMNATSDICAAAVRDPLRVVSSDLLLPVSCGSAPSRAGLDALRIALGLPGASRAAISMANAPRPNTEAAASNTENAAAAAEGAEASPAEAAAAAPSEAFAAASAGDAGVQAQALGIAAPTDQDGWLVARGGFCVERKLPKNTRGITAIAFAPDGRVFVAFDSQLAGEIDPLILYDAYHPSRAIAVFDGVNESSLGEILSESTRVTGLDWYDGALYVSRAGEVGTIPDGGEYKTLAAGFAVTSNLFHANNGIVISDGWVYVSAGGVIDGYSDGPIVGIGEEGAQQIVSGGNPYAARIVRAPLGQLLTDRSIGAFSTAARGVRNPYGITADPAGRIWFTDNGATNLPDNISAGDEVNVLSPGAIGGGEGSTPYYGFPLALSGSTPDWYVKPVLALENTAAPTGIAWAYDTVWFGQYGRNPGLYRLARGADGRAMAERVLLGWPVLALATAPDGALWMGMGDGGLYRITPGCAN
jgi:glucose/arabinose dehydrogenase